ncbi:PREDICTED: pentatricopeptide repeat-containing protein At2g13420, mitochondrial-like [Nelumbo nucifera]|uniref:Pentatricopeptide repeat-containing protein At2g13420, mitochondrial-like n=2 Tax=Nelumbo nucifera TaxID=4432 RepID=A0A1U8AB08_NELNU|nr:PREDICTED: pentatricopeptide repeat-containing protein At2g13420, mitochondrial-like [Nelumbo nucifera]XP_010258860.1 PREDICTED: pentatricopeptide repeat-containing protein At2g13420, mitochondrial-like [Nelumbo nucifera]XP_010258863.1 PREDICTED: pentatricopeptide repeat-containing protein At2g13420, mitochondrial-like [Nelumbo nucifera]XP_010258864.1 PREDICTED: pentatricopeptide repeat-containing protein At2g13420, mitochondrial-like [Nelumbo nucifera]XP_019053546.1 PREDICTED: pentatricopep
MAFRLAHRHFSLVSYSFFKIRFLSYASDFNEPLQNEETELRFSETLKPALPSLQISKDVDMVSRILIEQHNPFHTMESSLQLNGIRVCTHLVHQTLIRLRNVSKIALGFFIWAKDQANYRHDAVAYDLMIDILGKVRQFDVAWQLIIEMDQLNLRPTSKTFGILIRRLIAAGLTRQAIRAFDDMENFIEREADGEDFRYLLDTLCKYGYVKVATEIFNKRKFKFEPDAKTYTVLIYGWCKLNKLQMAEKFFREMADRGFEPNIVTYNVLLDGICRRSSLHPEARFERTIRAAENLLDEMHRKGIEPDVTSYSIVLHVYSRAHKPDLSLDKINLMKDKGICPTIATYTSVIKCLCSCGRLQDAEELLKEMVANGVSPSAATYNCFFKEYRGRKDADSALKLYRKMKDGSSCMPSMHTYNILVGMFSKLDQMDIVREIWDDMKENGVGPDLDSYTLLIHGLCDKKKWRDACHFFVEMIEKGFLPQKITFETLYRGLIQSDMLRTWRRLKKKLEEESVTFGSEFQRYHFKPYRR